MASVENCVRTTKRPSFLIRDILEEEMCDRNDSEKVSHENNPLSLTLPWSRNSFLTKLSPLFAFDKLQFASYHPMTVLSRNHEYHSPVETAMSATVPLPVYIRTRSTDVMDTFGRTKRCRRSRTVFSELQLMGLERKFESHKYLSTPDRVDLAKTLGLSQIQVKTWYQNRRMKWKKQVLQRGAKEAPTKPKGRPKKSSYETQTSTVDCQVS